MDQPGGWVLGGAHLVGKDAGGVLYVAHFAYVCASNIARRILVCF